MDWSLDATAPPWVAVSPLLRTGEQPVPAGGRRTSGGALATSIDALLAYRVRPGSRVDSE